MSMKAFGFVCGWFHNIHGINESVGIHSDRALVHCREHDAYAWVKTITGYDGSYSEYDLITDPTVIQKAEAAIQKFEASPEGWKRRMLS